MSSLLYIHMIINKNFISEKFNAYFLFMAMALSVSVYLLVMSGNFSYTSQIDILLSPKNTKTAIHLDELKNNIVKIFNEKNSIDDEINITAEENNSLIELKTVENSRQLAMTLSEENLMKFMNSISKYYDIKNDLEVRIVNRNVIKNQRNIFYVSMWSIVVGSLLASFIQLVIDNIEKIRSLGGNKRQGKPRQMSAGKIRNDLKNVLNFNKEKIEKLSGVGQNSEKEKTEEKFVLKKEEKIIKESKNNNGEKTREFSEQNQTVFKKSSSPKNLPTALMEEKEVITDENVQEIFQEPTEEEFKRKLNQLLNK